MSDKTGERLDYNNILTNWEKDKQTFMPWLEHVCGVRIDLLHEADALIQTDTDLRNWIDNCFDGNFDNIAEANNQYKLLYNT